MHDIPYSLQVLFISRRTRSWTFLTNWKKSGIFFTIVSGFHSPLLSILSHSLQCKWRSVCKIRKIYQRLTPLCSSSNWTSLSSWIKKSNKISWYPTIKGSIGFFQIANSYQFDTECVMSTEESEDFNAGKLDGQVSLSFSFFSFS